MDFANAARPVESVEEIDVTVFAETRYGLARLGVEGDQLAVARRDEHPLVIAVLPIRYAAVDEANVRRTPRLPTARVIFPNGLASSRVDGGHLAERSARIQHAVRHEGCGFKALGPHPDAVLSCHIRVDRIPRPCDFQLAEVIRRNLVKGSVFRGPFTATVRQPLAV